MAQLKPSHFTSFPMGSLCQNSESEQVAKNIMVIRKRLSDQWPLTWRVYKREREKDGGKDCAWDEQEYFRTVAPMIADAIGAISFCPGWAAAARKITTPSV